MELLDISDACRCEAEDKTRSRVTLKDVIPAELGNVWVMGDEVVQEVSELVALAERHVAAHQVLVDHPQVEVVAEGVHVHQVPHLVALLREEHGELQETGGDNISSC